MTKYTILASATITVGTADAKKDFTFTGGTLLEVMHNATKIRRELLHKNQACGATVVFHYPKKIIVTEEIEFSEQMMKEFERIDDNSIPFYGTPKTNFKNSCYAKRTMKKKFAVIENDSGVLETITYDDPRYSPEKDLLKCVYKNGNPL